MLKRKEALQCGCPAHIPPPPARARPLPPATRLACYRNTETHARSLRQSAHQERQQECALNSGCWHAASFLPTPCPTPCRCTATPLVSSRLVQISHSMQVGVSRLRVLGRTERRWDRERGRVREGGREGGCEGGRERASAGARYPWHCVSRCVKIWH